MRESLRKLRNDRRYEKSMQYSDFYPPPPTTTTKKKHTQSHICYQHNIMGLSISYWYNLKMYGNQGKRRRKNEIKYP